MVNILHVINGWPSGGITEQTYLICKYLPKEFKQYSIGYCHFDGEFVKKFEDIGVECIHSDLNYSNLKKIIKEKNIHIVHKQTGGGDCPSYVYLLDNIDIPLIETLHCPRKSGIPANLLKKIVYTTEYTYNKNDKDHQDIMQSIQYSIDLNRPIVDKPNIRDKKLKVGRLGRIVPDKRIDIILDLAYRAYEEGLNIDFVLAGQIPQDYPVHIEYGKWFLGEVKKHPNVEYLGFVENKYEFWKTLDICINPTWGASFEIVFLEAMACGIPILTWDNSAAKYVVETAGIVTEESIESLYNGLKILANNPPLRALYGSHGIDLIKTKYSLSKFTEEYTNLYKGVYENFIY